MRKPILLIITCINVYVMIALMPALGEVLWGMLIAGGLAVWNFFLRGFFWQKVMLLIKVLKPIMISIIMKGTAKYFAKGALKKGWAWLHARYARVRHVFAKGKAFVFTRWIAVVAYWQALPVDEQVLIVVAFLPLAIVPLVYIFVKRVIRVFLAHKVGEAVTQKGVHKVINHPKVKDVGERVAHVIRATKKHKKT